MKRSWGVFSPKTLVPVLAIGAVAFGTVGLMQLLNRHGEAAIQLLPANAVMAMSFDNTPSPQQVPLFNEIKAAMDDSGLNAKIDEFLLRADPKGTLQKIRRELRGSFAVGIFGGIFENVKNEPDILIIAALYNRNSAESLMADFATKQKEGDLEYYLVSDKNTYVAFHNNYVLVSNRVSGLKRAFEVAKGEAKSLYEEPEFKNARSLLPSDATFMTFISGKALAKNDPQTLKEIKPFGFSENTWFAYSITLRKEGILIDTTQPADPSNPVFAKWVSKMPTLHYSVLEEMPAGALGAAALSNPSSWWDIFRDALKLSGEAEDREILEGIHELEEIFGLSFEKDFLPAFRGEVNAALYPPKEKNSDPYFVISIDNSNNGKATEIALQLIEKANAGKFDSEKKIRFDETKMGEYRVFRIRENSPEAKEIAIAINQDKVLFVYGKELLDKIVAGVGSESLLHSDAFMKLREDSESRASLSVDMYQLVELLEQSAPIPPDVNLKQLLSQRELTANWVLTEKASTFRLVIPLDLPEVIRTVGKQVQKAEAQMKT
ncbi:MAG TPA: DUF3352 domain-containing protein [Fimbriimonadales bacterium]|nr:DUF3352 domain-containing protein [Fimbriimonadales bacterium]